MLLARLIGALDDFALFAASSSEDPDTVDVDAIHFDSRRVTPGSIFCCLVGDRADGHDFAREAVRNGAVALVVERPAGAEVIERRFDLPVIEVVVSDARRAMALMASVLEGEPSEAMDVVGITGTNGKTTTAHLLRSILEHAGRTTGMIGTLTGARTTPEAPDLQRQLAQLREDGATAVAMEVSSHALALHRVDGTRFRVAVFTNLGRDHLDFHADVENYFAAKSLLFKSEFTERAVICVDDEYGRRLAQTVEPPVVTYRCADLDADVGITSSRFLWRDQQVILPLGGRFNVCNAIAAAEAAALLGLEPGEIAGGLSEAAPVPGRFEPVEMGQDFAVLVDYAHTPDGLEQLLSSVAELSPRRVTVVFGCGGDRDRSKRPEMGAVASRHADQVIVTSDNPRGEDPMTIIDEVRAGIPGGDAHVEVDRRVAIELAIGSASTGDAVVIAGKGHETTQVEGDRVVPFDDREVAAAVLRERLGTSGTR